MIAGVVREPFGMPAIDLPAEQATVALFAIEGLAISALGEAARRGRLAVQRSAAENASLLRAEREARSQAERAIARSEGLQGTAAALGRALRIDEVGDAAVREGLAALGAGRGVVGILEADGHTIRTLSAHGFARDIKGEWPTYDVDGNYPLSEAMRLKEPVILHDSDEIRRRYPPIAHTTGEGGPAVVVPLLYEDRAIGGMYFRYSSPSAIAESDKPYLSALGRQCAAALERARLFEAESAAWAEAQRAGERISFLGRVGEALGGSNDIDVALEQIADLAVPAIADWAAVFLTQPDGSIRVTALQHRHPEEVEALRTFVSARPPTLRDGRGAGRVIATGQVELVADYETMLANLDLPEEAKEVLRATGVRSVMTCPIAGDAASFGAIALATTGARRFGDADTTFGEELGRRVGIALEKVRLNAALSAKLRGQEAVARVGQLALQHRELGPLFEEAAREIAHVLDADITAVMQLTDGRALRIVAGVGWRPGVAGSALIPASAHSQSGFALVSNGPVVSREYLEETRFRPSHLVMEHGARSGVTTPILGPDGPWGVLGAHSRTPAKFDPDQVALMETFANVLGSAVSRAAAELALTDREQRLELALAASRTGFWEWDVATGHISWSDEICRIHGLPPGTTLDSLDDYLRIVHPDDRDWVRREIESAATVGRYDATFRIMWPNGSIHWTRGTGRVFFDDLHRPLRMIGVGRDITEEKELEAERERMAEAERRAAELGQAFIGIASHELRTPITSIFAGSKLLRRLSDSPDAAEKRTELMMDIEAEAERLYRLTEDLLVLTRVERGNLEIGLEPVALPRVLERVIGSEQERWPRTTIELEVEPGIPIVTGDNTYIEQLIRNLVGNAAKYAPEGGSIEVVATAVHPRPDDDDHKGDEVEVRVLDRGPGLAEEDAEHLFELFYRSPLTAKKAPGAGIGLFVCDHLARAMGGRMWAKNRAGGGSEFGFSLRRYVPEPTVGDGIRRGGDGLRLAGSSGPAAATGATDAMGPMGAAGAHGGSPAVADPSGSGLGNGNGNSNSNGNGNGKGRGSRPAGNGHHASADGDTRKRRESNA